MKTILIIIMLLICSVLSADEWIKVKGVDYKLTKIDTLAGIVIADGHYDIEIVGSDTTITYTGGLGRYFFYENNENNTLIKLPKEIKNKLKKPKKAEMFEVFK